jgi:hypothetical protein
MAGIDTVISNIKQSFEDSLWKNLNTTYYGKVFRNEVALGSGSSKIVAEIFDETTGDYKDVMFDDTKDALCFFDTGELITGLALGQQPLRNLRIVFVVNLEAVNGNFERDTESAYLSVLSVLRTQHNLGFEVESIQTGEAAYSGLNTDRLKQYNIQPYHTFAIVGKAKIFYNNC